MLRNFLTTPILKNICERLLPKLRIQTLLYFLLHWLHCSPKNSFSHYFHNDTHWEKQEFVRIQEFVTTESWLLLIDLFDMFTQGLRFYKLYCLSRMSNNFYLLLCNKFYGIFEMVFGLRQKRASSQRFLMVNGKNVISSTTL